MTKTEQTSTANRISPEMAGGLLQIDLVTLASNWRTLRDNAGGAEASAVVKADAYGTGIEQAVPALANAGCRTFFVAHLSEAIRVRAVAPEATVYVLNGLFSGTCPIYAEYDLRPVLGSFEEIEEWASYCRSQGKKREAAIHVDTGMNRLGLTVEQGLTLKDRAELEDFGTALLMSHFVSAEESDNPLNIQQIDAFNAVRATLPGVRASLANSSGIFLKEKPHFDLVRPGYALYGGNPTPDRDNPMSAVVDLEARIVQLRWVETDDTVGYNGRWLALGRRRIATLSIGYADGYPRSASARGKSGEELLAGTALVTGRPCPFAGNVSMDLITIDVTDIPAHEIKRGDTVTLIGGSHTIDEVGRLAGTIGYEILTSLGRRYARSYRGVQG
ncbi:alanine racemase [Microvirga sp. 2YAF29]|uniref:alanine racemase n=1 Tax=Microvirga sp. 2YAF29 TaxID=3233031 RepID=UPI003F9A90A9